MLHPLIMERSLRIEGFECILMQKRERLDRELHCLVDFQFADRSRAAALIRAQLLLDQGAGVNTCYLEFTQGHILKSA